jgi:hypothetical protein
MATVMQHSLDELGLICDHAAEKLYDRTTDEDALADIATIVLLVGSRLGRSVGPPDVAAERGKRTAASAMALAAVNRHLRRLGAPHHGVSDEEQRRVIDAALHLVVRVLEMLRAPSRPMLGAT